MRSGARHPTAVVRGVLRVGRIDIAPQDLYDIPTPRMRHRYLPFTELPAV
jgi:hypothetical protein